MSSSSISGRKALFTLVSGHRKLIHRQLCCACFTRIIQTAPIWRRPQPLHTTHTRSFSTAIAFLNDKQQLEFEPEPQYGPETELETDLETKPEPEIDSRPQPETELEIETETEVDTTTESDFTFLSLPTSEPSISENFRRFMRRVPHPVVILTTRHPPSPSAKNPLPYYKQLCAMTVSSFTSVTLDPSPIISFNMKLPSKTYDALKANDGRFLIHVPQAAAEQASMAMAFTKGQDAVQELLTPVTTAEKDQSDPMSYKTAEQGPLGSTQIIPLERSGGAPLLKKGGWFGTLACKLLPDKEMQVSDHVVLCAEVLECPPEHVMKRRKLSRNQPFSMVYVNGAFRGVQKSAVSGDESNPKKEAPKKSAVSGDESNPKKEVRKKSLVRRIFVKNLASVREEESSDKIETS